MLSPDNRGQVSLEDGIYFVGTHFGEAWNRLIGCTTQRGCRICMDFSSELDCVMAGVKTCKLLSSSGNYGFGRYIGVAFKG